MAGSRDWVGRHAAPDGARLRRFNLAIDMALLTELERAVLCATPFSEGNIRPDHMAKHRVTQLRLEPGAFRRHDATRIGDGHQVLDTGREHRESACILAAIDQLLQLPGSPDAADKVDALARARVLDTEHGFQHVLLQERHVEPFNRVSCRAKAR